jgi:hypothetical protein
VKDGKFHLVKLSGDPKVHNEPKDEDTITFNIKSAKDKAGLEPV